MPRHFLKFTASGLPDTTDELFGGNSRYISDAVFDRYDNVPKVVRRGLLEPLLGAVPAGLRRSVVGQAYNYTRFANMSRAS